MKKPSQNDRLLLEAVLANDNKEIKFLLSIGANPNHLFDDEGGISPFHIAVGVGTIDLTRLFLRSEANVNLRCSNLGWTPMHVCAYWDKSDILELLLEQKSADPFILCNNENTVLETAIRNSSKNSINVIENYFRTCNQAQLARRRQASRTINESTNSNWLNKKTTVDSVLDSSGTISDISLLNKNDTGGDLSSVITSTFNDESRFSEYLPELNEPAKRTTPYKKASPSLRHREIQNKTIVISSAGKDEQDCWPVPVPAPRKSRKPDPVDEIVQVTPKKVDEVLKSVSKGRFQSPPSLPPFYSEVLRHQSKKATVETQTTSPCIIVKKKDVVRRGDLVKSQSPEPKYPEMEQGYKKQMTQQDSQTNVMSSIKKWLFNKFSSSNLLDGTETHDFQAELNRAQHDSQTKSRSEAQAKASTKEKQGRASSLTAPTNRSVGASATLNSKHSTVRPSRDSSLGSQKKSYAPLAPHVAMRERSGSQENMYTDLNGLITDNIGSTFFQNVLGKSDSVQSMSQHVKSPVRASNKNGPVPTKPNRQPPQKRTTPIKKPVFTPTKKTTTPTTTKPIKKKSVMTTKSAPSPSPREYFPRHMSSDSATLTPNTYTSDDSFEDPFQPDSTLITIDCSVDDLNTSDRKSTSTKIGQESNENNLYELLSDQFSKKINIQDHKPEKQRPALKKVDRNEQVVQQKRTPNAKVAGKVQQVGYSMELMLQLENRLNLTTTSDIMVSNMFECFGESPGNSREADWREGHIKSAFNYVLIDPRISGNLPVRAKAGMEPSDVLRAFVDSIFYIGKGSRARPYAHLHDTVRVWKGAMGQGNNGAWAGVSPRSEKMPKKTKKIDRIIDIWEEGMGVVSLHIFQSVIPCEAYTREAAMIDAIGIHNLTNVKKGNYYGTAKNWKDEYKRKLGAILLKKACAIFLAEGERQIKPEDI